MIKRTSNLRADALGWVIAAGLTCANAYAETPLGLSLTETLTYDSNVLRNRNKQSDIVSTTEARVSLNKDYGRQNYRATVAGVWQRYKDLEDYDNDGYEMSAGVTSGFGANGLASLDHVRSRQAQDFGDQGRVRYREEVDVESTTLSARYGLYGRYGFSLRGSHDKITYDINDDQDQVVKGLRLGVRYSPSDLLYFDFGVKKSRAEYDKYRTAFVQNGSADVRIGDRVNRHDFNVISSWEVSGLSRLNAELGWTRERYEYDDARDFNGWTGRASWRYTPRGKVSYSLAFSRDTNNAGGYSYSTLIPGLGLMVGQTSRQRLTTALEGEASWQATSKINASIGLNWRKIREEDGNPVLGTSTEATGNYHSLSAGMNYKASRLLSFNCSLTSYKRDETILAVGYKGEAVSCSATFTVD